MPIEPLKRIVTPPQHPSEVGTLEQWRAIEHQLGTTLPSDYRDFVFTYGSGLFARFYRVYNPFAASEWTALYPSVQRVCDWQRDTKRRWTDRVPYSIYPDQPGILPWGNDENGNDYCWITDGPPETWLVASDGTRGEGFREHGCAMTEFLTNVLLGECRALAGEYPTDEDRVFEAWTK